jgi:hypothetical protein
MGRLPVLAAAVWMLAAPAFAQEHDHAHMHMNPPAGWQFMQDGIVFVEFNHQGGNRGGSEIVAPNWWMGMATRSTSKGQVTLTGMLSLDAASVGNDGYREIFQVGEALGGHPLIDRQHPHDFFMQLSASWRIPQTDRTGLTITGAAAGEPALGPTAFMHRASALDNPTAPLGHHTFDSTHVSFGVVTAALERGKWALEGSIFNGREPDDRRWDFDFGRLDSVSGRLWLRPASGWELQVSTGRLQHPEALEPGAIVRSTASVSWTQAGGGNVASVTAGYGRNDTDHGARAAAFVEGARRIGFNTVYGRIESLQLETLLLETDHVIEDGGAVVRDRLTALTAGGVRDVFASRGLRGGIGGDVTFYAVPSALETFYGGHPVSVHVFFRVRPNAGSMWNMRMGQAAH